MRTTLRKSFRPAGLSIAWPPAALLRRNRSRRGGGDEGPTGAAVVTVPTIRRNGNRFQTVSHVPRPYVVSASHGGRRPYWSPVRVQSGSTLFRRFPPPVENGIAGALASLLLFLLLAGTAAAQPDSPQVAMRVVLPDGRTEELVARESGLATLRLSDGTEYGFRPTIRDSMPWNHVTVTIFKMGTTTPSEPVDELQLKTAGSALRSHTEPSFKVSIVKVTAPVTTTPSTT